MSNFTAIIGKNSVRHAAVPLAGIRRFFDNGFGRNLKAFGSAEVVNKITRIVAMVIIARSLSIEALGVAAIALTSFELIRIITNNGIGQMIVRASDDELEAVSIRAHQLNFLVCGSAALIQFLVGFWFWQYSETPTLFAMCAALSLVFIGMPFGLVRIFRAIRRNRMVLVAKINFYQVSSDNLLALVFALLGLGAWALVLPKLVTFPIWLIGARRSDHWSPCAGVNPAPIESFYTFCGPVLATETLKGMRLHADKALIGALLGVEALGIYFFAVNAGLGLAQTISMAYSACLYPHLCLAERQGRNVVAAWSKLTTVSLAVFTVLFALQAAAAPVYVPIIFGASWANIVPLIVILCLAATPRLLGECASQLARVQKITACETVAAFISFATSMAAITVGAWINGLTGAAIGLVLAAWVVEPTAALIIRSTAQKGQGELCPV